ncbi:class I SAM-dependent methyltransferase [Blastococcus sp. BMG 814]|uniref:Class I SAM-dependent methyltransferase n=1 Tax=Blastococcus carthaginiensis TaxID=3050034 RepID=A0ABT9IG29_9ACTN|nr:class I SAM-dependent methyltransferase [Blastococcus carthaginiensis]MDP5184045.1 class I SAM-dependent methyltransferase [Blastococcus carthaginiensis]
MTTPEPAALQARARSFGGVAGSYAALRPTYPADAVEFLLGRGRALDVLDLGAGTGLLTEVVLGLGHRVRAVDPSPEMLAELAARLPAVATAVGTAEQIPTEDAAVDAVVAGQAAHWFDPGAAARELRRVLRPGGLLGLVWNTRDERVPWVGALGEVISDEARGHEADQAVVDRFAAELGADVEVVESAVVQHVTPEHVVAGIATRSYVAVMDDARRAEFLSGIRELLGEHPGTRGRTELELPYRTHAYRLTPR